MVTAITDETGEVVFVTRTITVTPEQPGQTTPNPPAAITTTPIRLRVRQRAASWNLSQASDTTQHQYANAVTITPNGNSQFGYQVMNMTFTASEATPPGIDSQDGYRAAWWKYTCYADATMNLVAAASTAPIALSVFEIDAEGNWAPLMGGQNLTVNETVHMTYGNTYYFRVASLTDIFQTYNLSGSVTIRIIPGVILAQPLRVRLQQRVARMSQPHIDAVPITVSMSLHGSSLKVFSAPPIKVVVGVSGTSRDITLTPTSPAPGEIVASNPPQFIVGLVSTDDPDAVYTIEIQYDDNRTFTSPITLDTGVEVSDGGAIFTPTGQISATTWWRARLLQNGEQIIGWSVPRSFTVSTAPEPAELTVTWTVDPTQNRPIHLWHLDPDGGEVGDEVTAYGQGFPSTGNLVIGLTSATIVSWRLVPADPTAAPEPTIEDDIVTPEHYEVVFQVPDVEEPGGTLTVEA